MILIGQTSWRTLRLIICFRNFSRDHCAFSYLVKFFPPVVTGSVVTIIGINLMPVAMNYLAGGEGAKNYGDPKFDFRWRDIGHHSNFTKVYERLLEINCYPHRSCIRDSLSSCSVW